MYVRSGSPKYLCRKCNNKIPISDLEGIFHDELKIFFTDTQKIAAHMIEANENLAIKEQALLTHERTIQKLKQDMAKTHRLYLDGHLTPQGFGECYKPAEQQLNQLMKELP